MNFASGKEKTGTTGAEKEQLSGFALAGPMLADPAMAGPVLAALAVWEMMAPELATLLLAGPSVWNEGKNSAGTGGAV
jgi:hypothetical protein